MKCPYRTITIHKNEETHNHIKQPPKDIVEFGECYLTECPFYYKILASEFCKKANKEIEE